ncbi:ABC transporter ATP-binding protein [Aggregicoccus sp. 17bor-14]|uniref:ABC transporter ATP-binding protein n=1 Tax=Myxococcaceae TaxID=31 RepID=UPI0012F1C02F|nr:ABC transporter ATP-binding protein [Simulacricoccus sp. 17bor-14]MRI90173.1 ABC transporter ATP-binding protein [Aggregicoccus sp. 17bor-14]
MGGIHVEGLGKRFGARVAVQGLSFEVRPGEVFGLLGPNGAGKTTTLRMLAGLLRPSEGRAQVFGHPVGDGTGPGGERLRQSVGLLTEQPGLYERLSARENLRFFLKLHERSERVEWPRLSRYLERFGLAGREDEPCGALSKGMRQKLALVRALVHDPPVLFLDEPTSGLDPEAARAVRDALAELAREGRTLLLCSHNLAEVEQLCGRIGIVKGRLLAFASVAELQRRAGAALEVRVEGDATRYVPLLQALPFVPRVSADGERLQVTLAEEAQAPDVLACLVGAGARVHAAVPSRLPLEEIYLEHIREA